MARDEFSAPVKRLLGERAAYRCSNPDCGRITIGASKQDDSKVLKPGVAAHICAASEGGPRYDHTQSPEDRASASNGIWLCATCADTVDKNKGIDFSVELLRRWKEDHELRTFTELSIGTSEVGLAGWCEEASGKWKLFVKNPTVAPFYDCVVYGYRVEHLNEPFADIEVVFGTIPPRQTIDDTIDFERLESKMFGFPIIELEYTDSEGIDWRRDRFGKLSKIDFRRPFD